mmetsp:Transcript_72847/g.236675  ORF Transcript_72847/g.236675 Transcript_72847/m.236675 type:complete len:204 (+) Transcript_72847:224-835(+)
MGSLQSLEIKNAKTGFDETFWWANSVSKANSAKTGNTRSCGFRLLETMRKTTTSNCKVRALMYAAFALVMASCIACRTFASKLIQDKALVLLTWLSISTNACSGLRTAVTAPLLPNGGLVCGGPKEELASTPCSRRMVDAWCRTHAPRADRAKAHHVQLRSRHRILMVARAALAPRHNTRKLLPRNTVLARTPINHRPANAPR